MTGRLVRTLKRWTGFARIACPKLKKKKMGRPVKFTPANFQYRGTVYQKHHSLMVGSSKKFIANEACPICKDYLRVWRTQTEDSKTSACVSCSKRNAKNKKKSHKYVDNKAVERRRAIEAHQQKLSEEL